MDLLGKIVLSGCMFSSSVGYAQNNDFDINLVALYASNDFKGLEAALKKVVPLSIVSNKDALNALRLAHVKLKLGGELNQYSQAGKLYGLVKEFARENEGRVPREILCSGAYGVLLSKNKKWELNEFEKNVGTEAVLNSSKWFVDKSHFYAPLCGESDLFYFFRSDSLFLEED
jgi:hypothetical protein